jgi:integrase
MKVMLQELRLDERYKRLQTLAGKEFPKIKNFIDLAKNGENSQNIDITDKTERKYLDAFCMAYTSLKKSLLTLTKEDLTELKQNLKNGKIKSRFNEPYALSSQQGMETILIKFLETINPKKYSGFRKWFVVKIPKKDVDYLKEAEVEKLYKSCKSNAERFLIAVLFDSGARASEFLNIRFEDITEPTSSFPYYKINLKEEYSKTKGRNIGLYWKHSSEAIRDYLKEIGEIKPKEPVFTKTYDSIRIFLSRFGKKILKKRIHFHIFRRASATFYANKLKSRQNLVYRYGWTYSSEVPDVYISREQGEEEVKESIMNTTIEELQKKFQEEKINKEIEIEKLQNQLSEFSKFSSMLQQIANNPKMIKILER